MQQLCSLGPPLGREVQAASASVTTSFLSLVPDGGICQISLTLGWVQGVGCDEPIGGRLLEAA